MSINHMEISNGNIGSKKRDEKDTRDVLPLNAKHVSASKAINVINCVSEGESEGGAYHSVVFPLMSSAYNPYLYVLVIAFAS